MRQHGLFAPTASGPLGPHHFLLIYASWFISRITGGTFIILMEDDLATLSRGHLRDPIGDRDPSDLRPAADYWAEHIMADLNHFGMGPSTDAELRAQGFDGKRPDGRTMGVRYQSDNVLTQHYYRDVLRLEEDFGPWPPLQPDGMAVCNEAMYLRACQPPEAVIHPYLILNWAIEEMSSGRTFAIDGDDLKGMMGQYTECAFRVHKRTGWPIPGHHFIPTLLWQQDALDPAAGVADGLAHLVPTTCLSSSSYAESGAGLTLREAVDAGIDRETILAYMLEVAVEPAGRQLWTDTVDLNCTGLAEGKPIPLLQSMKRGAVVDERDWHRFCATGQVSKLRKKVRI